MRSRTTLAATIVVACALVLGSVVLVTLLTSSLEGNIETAAELRAADLGATISSGTDLEEIAVRDEEDSFVQVLDEQDRVILSSSNVEGEPAILPIERNQVATVDPAPVGEGTEGSASSPSGSTLPKDRCASSWGVRWRRSPRPPRSSPGISLWESRASC